MRSKQIRPLRCLIVVAGFAFVGGASVPSEATAIEFRQGNFIRDVQLYKEGRFTKLEDCAGPRLSCIKRRRLQNEVPLALTFKCTREVSNLEDRNLKKSVYSTTVSTVGKVRVGKKRRRVLLGQQPQDGFTDGGDTSCSPLDEFTSVDTSTQYIDTQQPGFRGLRPFIKQGGVDVVRGERLLRRLKRVRVTFYMRPTEIEEPVGPPFKQSVIVPLREWSTQCFYNLGDPRVVQTGEAGNRAPTVDLGPPEVAGFRDFGPRQLAPNGLMRFLLRGEFFTRPSGSSFEGLDEDDDPVAIAWQLDGRTVKYEAPSRHRDESGNSFDFEMPEFIHTFPRGTSQMKVVLADPRGGVTEQPVTVRCLSSKVPARKWPVLG